MPSPFYLVGPTAAGKTRLALEIAERCGAEIVGADAFQVYTGLDLLTAKASPDELRRVPHHLVGTVSTASEYNVARYLEEATRCLAGIAARGRPAIVVGGSGLYVRALTHGLSPLPAADPVLRMKLETLDLHALVNRLRKADPEALGLIDTKNKRRVIRAIEICETGGQRFSATRMLWQQPASAASANGFFVFRERSELCARIRCRVQALVPGGVLEEVRALSQTVFSSTAGKIIGLAEICAHLRGELDQTACLASIEVATRQYAKRQMTWFRSKSDFEAMHLTAANEKSLVARAVSRILSP